MRFAAFAVVLLFSEVQSQQQCSDSLGSCGGSRASLMQVKSLSQKLQASTSRGASTHAQTLAGFQKYTQELVDQYLQDPPEAKAGAVSSEVQDAIGVILSYLDKLYDDLKYFHDQDKKDAKYCAEVPQRCKADYFNSSVVDKIDEVKETVDDLKGTLLECRQQLQEDCISPSCPDYHQYRKQENTIIQFLPGCAKRGNLAHQAAASDGHELRQFEQCLQPTQDWLDPLYAHYINCRCPNLQEGEECKDAEPITEDRSSTCTGNQVDFEEAHCHWNKWISVHCESHDNCLEHGRKQCEEDGDGIASCTRISANSQARQADNETAERIRCLLNVLVTPDEDRASLLLACHNIDYTTMNEFWQIPCEVDVTQSADDRCTNSHKDQCSLITKEYENVQKWAHRKDDDACFDDGAYFDTCETCDSSSITLVLEEAM